MKPEVTQDEIKLLVISSSELCDMLDNRRDLHHVRQNAYEYLSPNGEVFQVQVTVTRREDDFLEAFQTEEMKDYLK